MISNNCTLDALLINPPFARLRGMYSVYFPLGIGYLAAALRKHCKVAIYNMEDPLSDREELTLQSDISSFKLCYSRLFSRSEKYKQSLNTESLSVWEEGKDVFLKYRPKAIGITCKSAEYPSALKVAQIYKECFSEGIVIFGGQHPTIRSEEILSSNLVDFLVRGEGEETTVELVSSLLDKDGSHKDFSKIRGISFFNGGSVLNTEERNLLPNLDAVKFPARDLLIKPMKNKTAYGEIITSRGCSFDCGYCSAKAIWGRKVRYRSVQNVINEIKEVIDIYKINTFNFRDDTFTLNRTRTLELLAGIKRLKIEWECTTRVDLVDYPLVKEMKRAGCVSINYGIESGSEQMLKKIGKNITLKQINKANLDTVKAGIIPKGFLMVGFPDGTENDIRHTIEFVIHTRFEGLGLSVFTPYPGTSLFERVKKLGMLSKELNWEEMSHLCRNNFFTQCISLEKFQSLLNELIGAVDSHNSSLQILLLRIRILLFNDPKLFLKKVIFKLKNTMFRHLRAKI